jgi:hypothetical protein
MIRKLNEESDPIGVPYRAKPIDVRIMELADEWDAFKQEKTPRWWEIWKWGTRVSLTEVTKFLLGCLDELINMVENLIDLGPDKKATVLKYIDKLYEYVVREAMPIWLKPFAGQVKKYIIYSVISPAIDWIVKKYRGGKWGEMEAKPAEE